MSSTASTANSGSTTNTNGLGQITTDFHHPHQQQQHHSSSSSSSHQHHSHQQHHSLSLHHHHQQQQQQQHLHHHQPHPHNTHHHLTSSASSSSSSTLSYNNHNNNNNTTNYHQHHHHQLSQQQQQQQQYHLDTTTSPAGCLPLLVDDDFGDDFDVSLSGLCLDPATPGDCATANSGSVNGTTELINSVNFGSLSDIVKVEEEFGTMGTPPGSVQSGNQLPGLASLSLSSPPPNTPSQSGNSSETNGNKGDKQSVQGGNKHNSLGSLMIGPMPPHQHRNNATAHLPQLMPPVSGVAGPSQTSPPAALLMSHLELAGIPAHHRQYDPNEGYYGDNSTEDSCQSFSSDASALRATIARQTTNPHVLESVLVGLIQGGGGGGNGEEKQNSKRIRFKGQLDQLGKLDPDSGLVVVPEGNGTGNGDQTQQQVVSGQANDAELDANGQAMLEQNPFAFRVNPSDAATLQDAALYSARNMANCYSYAWRRWSKTDAPSVKNRAGTVQVPHTMPRIDEENRKFQYILGAPTSAGTRVGSMTMTYLNQGQSYEIRLKKLKKVPQEPNLKTCVRIGFVEKRLQYRENDELAGWLVAHNRDRMIDIDFSMSYGVFDVNLQSQYNHSMTFVWNPGREASIFIKINCISTEFTSKRHGGERGTPFRLVVETYSLDGIKLDAACCLTKVFKSKGAERKHKTDRDRVSKHPDSENYYQPSYDCTLLTAYKEEELAPPGGGHGGDTLDGGDGCTERSVDSPLSDLGSTCGQLTYDSPYGGYEPPVAAPVRAQRSSSESPSQQVTQISSPISSSTAPPPAPPTPTPTQQLPQSTSHIEEVPTYREPPRASSNGSSSGGGLPASAGAIETYEWLKRNRFFRLAEHLCDYTAEDLRRVSRDDLIQLCDLKDGIRLYNLLHAPPTVSTRLTIYITTDGNEHYAIYLKSLSVDELCERLMESFYENSKPIRIRVIKLIGPTGIRVRLTNNVIENMRNESIWSLNFSKVEDEYEVTIRLVN